MLRPSENPSKMCLKSVHLEDEKKHLSPGFQSPLAKGCSKETNSWASWASRLYLQTCQAWQLPQSPSALCCGVRGAPKQTQEGCDAACCLVVPVQLCLQPMGAGCCCHDGLRRQENLMPRLPLLRPMAMLSTLEELSCICGKTPKASHMKQNSPNPTF